MRTGWRSSQHAPTADIIAAAGQNTIGAPAHGAILTDEQGIRTMTDKITPQPEYDALNAFDAENSVEPFRTIAERIAVGHDFWTTHLIVDEISHALEDAYNLGVKRGPLVPHPQS